MGFFAARATSARLFGVEPTNLLTYASISLLVPVTALAGSFCPAVSIHSR